MLLNLANLPYWIFLGLGILLFLLVIAGGGGDEDLDIDADADADIDADADFSLLQTLGWLGVGQAPLLLLLAIDLSLWGAVGWMFNVLAGSFFGGIPVNFFGLGGVVFLGSMALSLFAGSLIAKPLGKIFASFGEDASSDRLIGCIGTVSSVSIPRKRIGQVDVLDAAHNLVTVSASLPSWATVIPLRGDKVMIIERLPEHYLVITSNSADEAQWLANSSNLK